MNNNNIENKIKNIISKQLKIDLKIINDDSILKDDLNFDILDILELVIEIENIFNIEIMDEDIDKLNKVIDIINFVKNKINK